MNQYVKIITINGSFNSNTSSEFQQNIAEIVQTNTKIVLVDFQNVIFMDSSGLGALILAFKALKKANIKMVLCSINQQVKILFELTSMDDIFEIYPNQDAFNQMFSSTINRI
ncbi:STAS domain-containing protein [Cronbergia sp. UHCC 0137]|uniref:STAS domain-containing protein n=1 Tax=Cronbergia sp. UHCC 0137 TaxID=3110239 RepID=UPI002B217161|nr:STAS domain-containing protein [Cronbergia sp. UHCC 0137]MEA5620306.1 STAS domain-containing protein [Cronbergia sp. UHCC 0137]